MSIRIIRIASLILASLTARTAFGQATAYEGFGYAPGTSLNGLTGGTGWAGSGAAWADISASATTVGPGLSYGPLQTTAGAVAFSSNLGQLFEATRNMATTVPGSGTFWVSFLLQRNANTTTRPFQIDEYAGVSFGGTSTILGERVFVGAGPRGTLPNTNVEFTVGTSGFPRSDVEPSSGTPVVADATTHSTVLIVARVDMDFSFTTERIQVFVNPSASALGNNANQPSSPNATHTMQFNSPSNTVSLEYGNGGGYLLDEFRMGATWADVTPVPEPVSLFAASALGAGLLGLRRRFKK